jgi:hypothetical protein
MSDVLTQAERNAIDKIRDKGFAVAMFTPEELGETDPGRVEDMMVERGWSAIEDLKVE